MKTFVIAVAALATFAGAALAHPGHDRGSHKTAAARKAALTCPVTGDKIASADKAVGHSAYKGKTYYFCCPECKPRFDKNPARFVKNAAKGKYEKM